MKTKTFDEFIEGIAEHYPASPKVNNNFIDLKKTKFSNYECLFV